MHWLILDVNYLCWRAFHSTGHLSYQDVRTGVIYGLLRDVVDLKQRLDANHLVFCFDSQYSKREQILPTYKSTRREQRKKDPEEKELARFEMIRQVQKLRKEYLRRIGFSNILIQKGYEADDMIAMAVDHVESRGHTSTIVSSDQDLFQLLSGSTRIWKPSKLITIQSFTQEYKISPREWHIVKAIAGCKTDDVPGVRGVGEKTAIKYVLGELEESSTKYQSIHSTRKFWRKNFDLVRLPFEGCRPVQLKPDSCTKEGWMGVLQELGIKSLHGIPINGRKR